MTDEKLVQTIESVLEEIRPNIQMDGGDVRFLKFEDGIVYVQFQGACIGCPAASYTLKLGIEQALKDRLSEVMEVIAVDGDEA